VVNFSLPKSRQSGFVGKVVEFPIGSTRSVYRRRKAKMRILLKCEDCLLVGWSEEDVRLYTRCPHCGGEFIFMSQKEIFDYQSESEPDELPQKSPYYDTAPGGYGLDFYETDLTWLLTDEDNEFNLRN
jgi:hypothetical protein